MLPRLSRSSPELLARGLLEIPQLADVPIVIGAPFGHTNPVMTLPIGGTATLDASATAGVKLSISSEGE